MQQQISVITLGISDLERSLRFYAEGFGWEPVFQNNEITFYQMNGLILGTLLSAKLDDDMHRHNGDGQSSIALAHKVPAKSEVQPLTDRLVAAGGTMLRKGEAPAHGGYRGYVADPDGHSWEIAWNPAWSIDENGLVIFGQ